jgi:hypothetical protein
VVCDLVTVDDGRALDVLLVKLLRHLRRDKIETVSITYYGSQVFIGKLKKYGFICREQTPCLLVYASDVELSRKIGCLESWHMFSGDNDV